jgi:hypothetical protein
MFYVGLIIGAVALIGLLVMLWTHSSWRRRDPFWRELRHHDHLIPPTPRSIRTVR